MAEDSPFGLLRVLCGAGGGGLRLEVRAQLKFFEEGDAQNACFIRSLPNDNKISDNKIRKISKIYCHGISQERGAFGQFSVKFPPPQPLQNANFINIVVSASLIYRLKASHLM